MVNTDTRLSRRRKPVASLLTTLTAALAVTTIASLFESAHWTLELFAHFRLQYLCAAIALLLITLITRRRTEFSAALALIAINGWFVGNYLLSASIPATTNSADARLTLIHANIQGRSQRIDLLLKAAREERADIILIQELNARGVRALSVEPGYPHRYLYPREDEFGIALVSKLPLNVQPEPDPSGMLTFLTAKIPWGESPLNLFYLHPPPPIMAAMADARNKLMDSLALRVRATPNVLVVGDINNTPWTQSFTKFVTDSELKSVRARRSFTGTWPVLGGFSGGWPLMLQIDHVFTHQGAIIADFRPLASIESDHLPLIFTLAAQ